jgi:hypothetical protein
MAKQLDLHASELISCPECFFIIRHVLQGVCHQVRSDSEHARHFSALTAQHERSLTPEASKKGARDPVSVALNRDSSRTWVLLLRVIFTYEMIRESCCPSIGRAVDRRSGVSKNITFSLILLRRNRPSSSPASLQRRLNAQQVFPVPKCYARTTGGLASLFPILFITGARLMQL